MGKKPKMRCLFVKFPLLSKIQTLSHKHLVRQTSNHHHCDQQVQIPIGRGIWVILSFSTWSKTILCIFKEQIWLPNRNAMEKYSIWPGRDAQNGLILHDVGFWMGQFQWFWDCTLRCFWVMGYMYTLSWKTTHHRTTFRIFCSITQNTIPEENSCKMFHISSLIVLFSYGKFKDIWFG